MFEYVKKIAVLALKLMQFVLIDEKKSKNI